MMLLLISVILTLLGLAICDSAKWMLNSATWKKVVAIISGSGITGAGAAVFGMAVGLC